MSAESLKLGDFFSVDATTHLLLLMAVKVKLNNIAVGPLRVAFSMAMLSRTETEDDFPKRVMFSHDATFHVPKEINKQNCRF